MMSVWCLSASLASAQTSAPLLYTVNGTQYVNPFDFVQVHGGTISGPSVGKQWTITLRGKTLKLVNNSATAYLDGRRVNLSKVVGYAKGVLLAPYADLARLLGVNEGAKAALPKAPPVAARPATAPRPSTPATAPTAAPSEQAQQAQAPAPVAPAPAPEPAARAPRPARAANPNATNAYVIQSDVPSRTDALQRANYQQDLGAQPMGVDAVVQACRDGVAKQLGAAVTSFAARPFVFVHPDNVYSVRSSLESGADGATRATTNFTCLTQLQGAKLVMFIEWQSRR